MDRVFHQLTVLGASICLGIVGFSMLFSASKSDRVADLSQPSQLVTIELSQSK